MRFTIFLEDVQDQTSSANSSTRSGCVPQLEANVSDSMSEWDLKWKSINCAVSKVDKQHSNSIESLNTRSTEIEESIKKVRETHTDLTSDLKTSIERVGRTVSHLELEICQVKELQGGDKILISRCSDELQMIRQVVDGKPSASKINGLFDDVKNRQQEASTKFVTKVRELESKQKALKTRTSSDLRKLRKFVKQDSSEWNTQINQVETKITDIVESMLPGLQTMIERNQKNISSKPCSADIISREDVQRLIISSLDAIGADLEKKSDKRDQQNIIQKIENMMSDIASIQGNLETKADMKELDKKPNILDMNQALAQVGEAFDKAASQADADHQELRKIQSCISAGLEEIGQWKWSGHLMQNGSVPWTAECKNSSPRNLVWELSKAGVMCLSGGTYTVEASFFSVKSPTVHLLVNSRVVASTSPPKRPKASISRTNILVATTCRAIIMLPAKSLVAVRIQGEHPIHGMLTLIRDPNT